LIVNNNFLSLGSEESKNGSSEGKNDKEKRNNSNSQSKLPVHLSLDIPSDNKNDVVQDQEFDIVDWQSNKEGVKNGKSPNINFR
jgi:hypothetical protein